MERRRSLLKDANDIKTFRHHRDRHLGHSVSNEFYQQTPFFFTRECASLNLVGQYKGASAFLVLNGPSLVSGDYDLSKLNAPGVVTYGVNNGPATFRPTFWSCVDDPGRFLKSIWLDPAITKFVPHAHAEKPIFDNDTWSDMVQDGKRTLVGECPNCVYFHRNEKFVASRWLFEDKINWGNSKQYGGCRTVMLPAIRILFLLGFRKIYLLGADFTMTEDYAYHFDEKREKGAVNCNMKTYKRLRDVYFPELQPYFKEEGLEILNCNPDSGLKDVFEYVSFNDAIEEATGPLGEVANERTWGMYCKPGDKDKTKDEPDDRSKKHLSSLAKRDEVLASVKSEPKKPVITKGPVVRNTSPVVKTTVVPNPVITEPEEREQYTKPYRVVSVENTDENDGITVGSSGILNAMREEEQAKTITDSPRVELVQEVPVSTKPIVGTVSGERKLIKHLPFRG
jgi:hypothetical protein